MKNQTISRANISTKKRSRVNTAKSSVKSSNTNQSEWRKIMEYYTNPHNKMIDKEYQSNE